MKKTAVITTDENLLKFSDPTSKHITLKDKGVVLSTFSIPAGWTCPGAMACLAKVNRDGGLVDGEYQYFRCFAASDEAQYPATRAQRWHNFDLLKKYLNDAAAMAEVIERSLPTKANTIRIHVSGDFFNREYFKAWCLVARVHPEILFFAYTKSIETWVANRAMVPSNLELTASFGGRYDELIKKHGLKFAQVVFSIEEANRAGLAIDHDDTHAMDSDCKAFALLLHRTQPKGSRAAEALKALKGLGSYSNKAAINKARALEVDKKTAA